jgi:hypothetical protein
VWVGGGGGWFFCLVGGVGWGGGGGGGGGGGRARARARAQVCVRKPRAVITTSRAWWGGVTNRPPPGGPCSSMPCPERGEGPPPASARMHTSPPHCTPCSPARRRSVWSCSTATCAPAQPRPSTCRCPTRAPAAQRCGLSCRAPCTSAAAWPPVAASLAAVARRGVPRLRASCRAGALCVRLARRARQLTTCCLLSPHPTSRHPSGPLFPTCFWPTVPHLLLAHCSPLASGPLFPTCFWPTVPHLLLAHCSPLAARRPGGHDPDDPQVRLLRLL